MDIFTTYSVKIKHYNDIFRETVSIYRKAVDFLIDVCIREWGDISMLKSKQRYNHTEHLVHKTSKNPEPLYGDFDTLFYKLPNYLRRGAIAEALGKVSSYRSNLANWEAADPASRGRKPSCPKAGFAYPTLYRGDMYRQNEPYTAQVKVYIRNTWDWITIQLRKSDMDYIGRWCRFKKKCAPALQKRGKEWFLDFPFEEKAKLPETDIYEQTIAAVDLGINSAATVSIMRSDGTILGRRFLRLPKETDCLWHRVNRIKKAQQLGNYKTPRLWAAAKGVNDRIAVLTANFIIDTAVLYNADVVVFEYLDTSGKKHGSKKQRLHMWRSQYVQSMVTDKAHRLGMRISRICAWNTSRLAFDGSDRVQRGKEANLGSYSVCKFQTGKIYNCDLNATYNIGARYFIREILKSEPEKVRLALEAKVPQVAKRSTCTLSTLISLNAGLASI